MFFVVGCCSVQKKFFVYLLQCYTFKRNFNKMDITEPCDIPGSSSNKLAHCEVCSIQKAKYTCPRCELKTCSLKCNKIHKIELECSGEKDCTKFIPLNKFTNLDLHSDYKLLEEISRSLESSKKKFGKKWNNSEYLMKVRNAARSRKINWKFLPYTFEKRRNNTTFFKFKDNIIYWHIEWVFFNAENIKVFDERISENEKISVVLAKYFKLENENPLHDKLQFYQAAGLYGVKVFLKAEEKKGSRYYDIDINSTIKEIFHNKTIIEYPTFHVVLKDHGSSHEVIDSDSEDETGTYKTGHEVVETIIKKANTENSSMKNLLFISECSDEELSD